jgi:ABC-2 type transport system ATP-binding protein
MLRRIDVPIGGRFGGTVADQSEVDDISVGGDGNFDPVGDANSVGVTSAAGGAANSARFLDVVGLVKGYGSRKAVDGIDFHIDRGECFGLLGPNGAGKTTTILAICGLLRPDSGTILVGAPGRAPDRAGARRDIGYVPQEIALYDDLTGRENLRFFGRLYGLRGAQLKRRVEETLEFVDLVSRGNDKVTGYSGGMKRRLNIAAALLHEPGLLVLDEPTVGIDPQSRNAILESLLALARSGVAILYTSHYMEEVERICDRIGVMDGGRILAEGSRADLLATLGTQTVQVRLLTGGTPDAALLEGLGKLDGVVSATAGPGGPELAVHDVARVLPELLAAAAKHDTAVNGLAVDQPNLETVFLHLTGKALRDG